MSNVLAESIEATISVSVPSGMVLIPSGPFFMGSDEGSDAERPVREVWVESFYIDEALVTNLQFSKFVGETSYETTAERAGAAWGCSGGQYSLIDGLNWRTYATPDRGQHPVVLVSWYDAQAFAEWAGKQLPTEAQWEKAARGGLVARYPWGDDPPTNQCNFSQPPADLPGTTRVKSFSPNSYGLYDMVGNVWQWSADSYGPYEVAIDESDSERSSSLRVRRGGAWNVIQPFRLRCSNRGAMDASSAVPNVGFRCVTNA
jgi:formylglycine-generating enzyme required for sulfatase activity